MRKLFINVYMKVSKIMQYIKKIIKLFSFVYLRVERSEAREEPSECQGVQGKEETKASFMD